MMFPEARLYIDGKLRAAENGATYEDISPWTAAPIAKVADASVADMDEAIAAARRAFDTTDWPTNKALRREMVVKLGEKLRANRDRLAAYAHNEAGSALGTIAFPQVDGPLGFIDELLKMFDAIEWEKPMGERPAFGGMSQRTLVKEAAGVVGVITPWNVPFYINIGKVIPALLAGCTVIMKPAPDTPLLSTIFGEMAAEVGFPAGVLNVVTAADPVTLGEMLVTDKRVDLISFTGSATVGRRIMEKGAPTLKRLFLELGGKSALIVLEDLPNFAQAVCMGMVCYHAGQGCATLTRLLVPRSRYDEAVKILEAAYAGYQWGDPANPAHVMGPLISAKQRERVMAYIEAGKAEGARLIAGGNRATDKGPGFFVEPTFFVDVTNDMKIAREEIFGPVGVLIPFEDDEDAIRIANDSEYGLSGMVLSGDTERAMKIARRIRAGTIGVNFGASITVDLPFGGYKQSGIGKEWGMEGFDEYLETKAVAVGKFG
ncbi:aldehyde dehydrogenase family protein [Acidocella sp.]|uniref:aldehyde dehydrogenase family protein n=1 Tax=Acidocella sp. TaxID=50710 RepID=UPI0026118072|nr:aldehyde dehydrogenase family protein [Acidocella sp.]